MEKKLNLNFHAKNSATNVNEARFARNVELDFSCFFKHRVAPAKNFRDILRLLPQAFVFYQCFKKCDLKMSFTVEKMLSPCNCTVATAEQLYLVSYFFACWRRFLDDFSGNNIVSFHRKTFNFFSLPMTKESSWFIDFASPLFCE